MTAVVEKQDLYFERFAALARERDGREPAWLSEIRHAAMDRFGDLGFPTSKHEEWRFTSVAPIARSSFAPAPPAGAGQLAGAEPGAVPPWTAQCHTLVFLNGRFAPELSPPGFSPNGGLPPGVRAVSLAAALDREDETVKAHVARHAGYEGHAFVALNTALFEDGALVEIAPDTALEKPLALVFVTLPQAEPTMTHPRSLIVVGRGSQASFIEFHAGLDSAGGAGGPAAAAARFTNAVTEVVAGENAVVDYTRVQDEGMEGLHVGILQVEQARSSSVTTHAIALGGRLDREEVRAVLNGEGAEALLHGLYVIGGHQHVDNHTVIDHAKPHCSSREVYKGVLDGSAAGVFNGKIVVRKDAQKTDSKQSNKNLLLSDNATINTKPQLEIYADDVKCTHGATIGQIDAEAVFYLRSRGIGLDEARGLLIQAFANDVLDRVKFEPLRASLRHELSIRLQHAHVPGEAQGAKDGERISRLEELA